MGALKAESKSSKLEAAQGRVLAWRQAKPKFGRMPKELWAEAVHLVEQFGLAAVARKLGLDYTALKQRVAASAVMASPVSLDTSFMEIPGARFTPGTVPAEVMVEVSKPSGARLTLRLPTVGVDVAGLIRTFCDCGGR